MMCGCARHWDMTSSCSCSCPSHAEIRAEQERKDALPEVGTVAVAFVGGKWRLLRYLPGATDDALPWVMDQTYDRGDYIQSNWSDDDPRLQGFEILPDRPPKPDEPTGLGAVVRDRDGRRWVRAGTTHEGRTPDCWRVTEGDKVGWWAKWSDIDVASADDILSEGVQS